MTLGAKVVYLVRLYMLNNLDKISAVGEVAVVEYQSRISRADPGKDDQSCSY